MRIFNEANFTRSACPICGTKANGEVVLIGIKGTEDGNNMEAIQVHVSCIQLEAIIDSDKGIIVQFFSNKSLTKTI